ncbi:MAG: PilZ domain-containing protein [Blastocatellia bacterium]
MKNITDFTTTDTKADSRRYRRVEGLFPVSLFCQGETYRVKATNLSTGGIFIATRLPLRTGSLVHLRIGGLPDKNAIQATGQVRFSHSGIGLGIRFFEISHDDVERISGILETAQLAAPEQHLNLPSRDTRLQLSLKLTVTGKNLDGLPFTEEVFTEDVSRRGVCLILTNQPGVGDVVNLSGLDGQFRAEGVVKYAHAFGSQWRAGIHFLSTPKKWVVVGMAVNTLSQWELRKPDEA